MLKDLKELNEKRILFFEIGLIVALGMVLILFNWRSIEQEWNAPINYNPEWDRVQQIEDPTPPTRQRTFTPPPPDIKITTAPLTGNIETVLQEIFETELATTEITSDRDVAIPAGAFTGESPSIPVEYSTGESEIFTVVEDMPQFPGGDAELLKFLYGQLRYPPLALESRIQGLVVVQFIIDEQGNITNPIVVRSLGGGCDEEALRVIKLMPRWTPGKQRGRPVRVRYNLPVRFQLRTD
ncbi:MAG: energy transducer TonB [Bacteroidia bacterium]